jgi:hypothetical protein
MAASELLTPVTSIMIRSAWASRTSSRFSVAVNISGALIFRED